MSQHFKVKAKLTKEYEVGVEAKDEADAIQKLDDWISDDFEKFEISALWEFEV